MIKVIRQGPQWALIRASWACVQRAHCDERVAANTSRVNRLAMGGGENVLYTFAKAFHKGAGLWLISGYAYDGSDVSRALERMSTSWRTCYEVNRLVSLARPRGAWIRVCVAAAPRERLLTMASCRAS